LQTKGLSDKIIKNVKEALYYRSEQNNVHCLLCPHFCKIKPDAAGICRNRINKNGKLFSLSFGNLCSTNIDPVEKKPLYHFLPGTAVYSIATAGCNFGCLNCQNYSISQKAAYEASDQNISPEKIVDTAKKSGCSAIAFTYTEPTAYYEYTLETARHSRKTGLKNILISNGYINPEPLEELCKYIDAANIDLKCFDNSIYKKISGGSLQPVLDSLLTLKKNNSWLEITNLIIPQWTDDPEMIKRMCGWMVENKLENCPLHFSRFFPTYKLNNISPTPVSKLEEAKKTALDAGIKYVYLGNLHGRSDENTYCPKCSKNLIEREGYQIIRNNIIQGKCTCGESIAGIWSN
jgi:pyruvate formate lyase activating enzyme